MLLVKMMQERYLSRNVKKETEQHYRGWPVHADARRHLYLTYAQYPTEVAEARGEEIIEKKPRDVWSEIATIVLNEFSVDKGHGKRGIDVGASSGYFVEQLLKAGYEGEILGVDIETGHQPFLQWRFENKYPDASILFGGANAQSLRELRIIDDDEKIKEVLKIRRNSFDFLTELFVLYHVPSVEKAYDAAHRILKPGGIAIFSGRDKLNQHHLWNLGSIIAQDYGVKAPESFYTHHSLDDMRSYLQSSPKFELLYSVSQAEHIWIPATVNDIESAEEGWHSMKQALMSLPYKPSPKTGESIVDTRFIHYLDKRIKPDFFDSQAAVNHGYFVDYVFQNYYVCQAIK